MELVIQGVSVLLWATSFVTRSKSTDVADLIAFVAFMLQAIVLVLLVVR